MTSTNESVRIRVFPNGSKKNGKLIVVNSNSSMHEFWEGIRQKFNNPKLGRLFSEDGLEASEIHALRSNETFYVSENEDFTESTGTSGTENTIKLNAGGQLFETTRTTLTMGDPNSMLAKMFDPNSEIQPATKVNGAYFIDRDPKYFGTILNYLWTGKYINSKGVLEEAKFFGIENLQIIPDEGLSGLKALREEISKLVESQIAHDKMKLTMAVLDLQVKERSVHVQEKKGYVDWCSATKQEVNARYHASFEHFLRTESGVPDYNKFHQELNKILMSLNS